MKKRFLNEKTFFFVKKAAFQCSIDLDDQNQALYGQNRHL